VARGRKAKGFESPLSPEEERILAETIASLRWDPLGFANFNYPWGTDDLLGFNGPKTFQREILTLVGSHLQNPATRYIPFKCAIGSGKGIGKTALISILIHWGLSTCVDTKIRVTANTDTQLRLVVWSEVLKWHRLGINSHWFDAAATSVSSRLPGFEKTWRADAMTWSTQNLEAFAGFHNYGKRLIAIVDEGSGVDDGVFDSIKGFLTDDNTELLVFVFGNPTKTYGYFYDIFHNENDWYKFKIDSRTVEGINRSNIDSIIREHGEDSDIFKVTVAGEFPSQSFEQYVEKDIVDAALTREVLRETQYKAPVIIGCDPAWTRDEVVITVRQGLWCKVLEVFTKRDGQNDEIIANKLAFWEDEYQADKVFIDMGWGTGVKTVGDQMNRKWELVAFGSSSPSPTHANLRAHLMTELKKWLKDGGSLGGDRELAEEIQMPERRTTKKGLVLVESKDDMKSRLKSAYKSPGRLDSLMMTFHKKIKKKPLAETWTASDYILGGRTARHSYDDYDPRS
jgi:hypothetical protein